MAMKPIGTLPGQNPVPHMQKIDRQREAEMALGRQKIKEHEDRERMIAAKRQREDEAADVNRARAANKVL